MCKKVEELGNNGEGKALCHYSGPISGNIIIITAKSERPHKLKIMFGLHTKHSHDIPGDADTQDHSFP